MTDFFAAPAVQAGAGLVVLCIMIAAAVYLVSSFRDYTAQDQESTPEALVKLEEMHRRGDISDQEFRTIKATTHQRTDQTDRGDESLETDDPSPGSQS